MTVQSLIKWFIVALVLFAPCRTTAWEAPDESSPAIAEDLYSGEAGEETIASGMTGPAEATEPHSHSTIEDEAVEAEAACGGCETAVEEVVVAEAAVAEECIPTPIRSFHDVKQVINGASTTTTITNVSVNYDYLTRSVTTITDTYVRNPRDFDRTISSNSTTIDSMWSYERCKWEEVTKWVDTGELLHAWVANEAFTYMGDYTTEAYSFERGGWARTMSERWGHDYGINTNPAGVTDYFIEMEYQNNLRYGQEKELDTNRLDDQQRPMYKVTTWNGDRQTVHWETQDGPSPLA